VNIAAIGGMVMPWLLAQGRLVQHHPFDLPVFLAQLAGERIAYSVVPPTILNMLLKRRELLAGADLTSLRCLGSGSAPLARWMVEGWQQDFGISVMNVFGSNEGCSLFSSGIDVPDPALRASYFPRFGVEGIIWSGEFPAKVRTRLVDLESGAEIDEPGQTGELRLDGAMIFDGYWQAPDLTEKAFDAEGWFRTGDLFQIADTDCRRFYQFVGRSKDVIIRGGINISPAELDDLVERHPAVREAACVGYPDARLGERVCAIVSLMPDQSLTLEALVAHLKEIGISTYKLPEKLRVIEALPRNPLGKVLRRELAAVAQS
jgi:acyl-CoA synthetase (AMP-forming)/AMP-acid ligase II